MSSQLLLFHYAVILWPSVVSFQSLISYLQVTLLKLILADLHSSWGTCYSFTKAAPRSGSSHMAWTGALISKSTGIAESTAPYLLVSFNMDVFDQALNLVRGTLLCFNNTCVKICLFAFKVVNYGVYFKRAITTKKTSLLYAYVLECWKEVISKEGLWNTSPYAQWCFEGNQTR